MILVCGWHGPFPDISFPLSSPQVPNQEQTNHSHSLDPPYTLAVLPLKNLTSNASLHWLGNSLSEMLVNDLAKWPSVSVIARGAIGEVLREQWLQYRGFAVTTPLVDLGNIQGARYLLRGGIHQYEKKLRVDLQIIDVETGVIESTLSAEGLQSEIPQIEYDLVMQLIHLFQVRGEQPPPTPEKPLDTNISKHGLSSQGIELPLSRSQDVENFGLDSVHRFELQSSLARLTYGRRDSYYAAEMFWQKGWSVELGEMQYYLRPSPENAGESFPLVMIPISLFMKPENIEIVLKSRQESSMPLLGKLEEDGISMLRPDTHGISQLFFGYVRQPRRLFVRSLNEQGEVMAVYSEWSWQTANVLQLSDNKRMAFPLWPQPFLSGQAEFPVSWIERGGQHVTFDIVVVPIPDERLSVDLDPIYIQEDEKQKDLLPRLKVEELVLLLKNQIMEKWEPAITEALPVEGHLPSNKTTVSALLHLQAGRITQIQFLKAMYDPLFLNSLVELKSRLLGYCVLCQEEEKVFSDLPFQTIRLQLTLMKDLHALQFGFSTN